MLKTIFKLVVYKKINKRGKQNKYDNKRKVDIGEKELSKRKKKLTKIGFLFFSAKITFT